MDNEVKVEKIRMEDGRHAERHVRDNGDEVVVEIHVEPEREMKLSHRVIEKKKPIVYERAVEKFNSTGEVVERKVESLDSEPKLEVRSQVERLKPKFEKDAEEKAATSPQRFVTRDELKDALVAALNVQQGVKKKMPVARKLTAAKEVESRVQAQEKPSWKRIAIVAVIIAQLVALGYILFVM